MSTVVRPGWLDALVDRVEDDGDIGLVGAKLVYPDGRLHEAGGIVWRNGSGSNYGRGDDPDSPAYSFPATWITVLEPVFWFRRESSMLSAAWTPATSPPTTRMPTSLSRCANWVTGSCTSPDLSYATSRERPPGSMRSQASTVSKRLIGRYSG